jgi:hypothetical protein
MHTLTWNKGWQQQWRGIKTVKCYDLWVTGYVL